ncbi:MAG: YajQ family cyclic di-GMP-binding protein [Myxococcales bacterium]
MPSFDVVSEVDMQELDNAVNNARKEIETRYDFRNTKTEISLGDDRKSVVLKSSSEDRLNAAVEVLDSKAIKRGISIRSFIAGKIEPAAGQTVRQVITIQQGIPQEKAKELVKAIKDSKLKVQASIQGDALRVTGKNKDDLQQAIALCRSLQDKLSLNMQFNNFRD